MAASLIDSMTEDFDPDAYHDSYREALQEVVDAKVEGREVVQPLPEQTIDTHHKQAHHTDAQDKPGSISSLRGLCYVRPQAEIGRAHV